MAQWLGGERLEEAIARTNGRSRGYDYLRIALSVGVVLWHSCRVSYGDFAMGPWLRPTAGLILPMFFALSGLLISGSLIRSRSVHEFVMLRAIRIFPALAVETVLSLLVIGTIFTTLPLAEFFAHPQTHAYLLNVIGIVHFRLPGVFETNPMKIVNISLWTVPFELECYAMVVVLWITRIIRSRVMLLLVVIGLQIVVPAFDLYRQVFPDPTRPVAARVLVLAFLFGILLFQFRHRVRLNLGLFCLATFTSVLFLSVAQFAYLVGLPAAYMTLYLGMKDPPKVPVLFNGDYSYGVYLYAFPIQQAVTSMLPRHREWWINAPVSLVLAGLCAAFSWHVVEKPILARRKHIVGATDRAIARMRGRRLQSDPTTLSPMDIKSES